jgi:uncharacterized protein (DUF2267 family)
VSVDLLVTVQRRGRLYGRNETRRAITAVLGAVGDVLPPSVFHRLAVHLPAEIRRHLPDPGTPVTGCRDFLGRIADRLLVDGPDAAFLARVVLENLNARPHGLTPGAVAHLAPADLRPLLSATLPDAPRTAAPALAVRPARNRTPLTTIPATVPFPAVAPVGATTPARAVTTARVAAETAAPVGPATADAVPADAGHRQPVLRRTVTGSTGPRGRVEPSGL